MNEMYQTRRMEISMRYRLPTLQKQSHIFEEIDVLSKEPQTDHHHHLAHKDDSASYEKALARACDF
ncbi:hypothetical protein QQP08_001316 [Theobroma cacao]|nr:hypothetical protein QQP08_001316 [Theobroma cacao]